MRVAFCLLWTLCGLAAPAESGCNRSFRQACGDLAEAECGRLADCSSALLEGWHGDRGSCERHLKDRCVGLAELEGTDLGSGDIGDCIAAYEDFRCEGFLLRARPPECRFTGTKTNGEGCASGAECQSALCKPLPDGNCECAAMRNEHDDCSQAGSPCAAGLFCGQDLRCVPRGILGAPCSPVAPCNPLYWCDDGKCAAPLGEGESCAGGASCDQLAGLSCAASGECELRPQAIAVSPCE